MKEFEKKIQQDFVDALKKGDTKVVDVLRMLKSSIQNKKVEKGKGASLSEDDYIVLLRRMIKQRKEAAEQYEAVGVRDRAEQERAEVSILEKYLPEQLSEEQILQLAKKIIEETGAKGISDLGKVMGKLMPHVKGKADGATVRNVVERLLR